MFAVGRWWLHHGQISPLAPRGMQYFIEYRGLASPTRSKRFVISPFSQRRRPTKQTHAVTGRRIDFPPGQAGLSQEKAATRLGLTNCP